MSRASPAGEHAGILDAIASGDGDKAEALVRAHISGAANFMVARLRQQLQPAEAPSEEG